MNSGPLSKERAGPSRRGLFAGLAALLLPWRSACAIPKQRQLDRVYFLNPNEWVCVEAAPLDFYDISRQTEPASARRAVATFAITGAVTFRRLAG